MQLLFIVGYVGHYSKRIVAVPSRPAKLLVLELIIISLQGISKSINRIFTKKYPHWRYFVIKYWADNFRKYHLEPYVNTFKF
jgi:hypothetical protein